jgi:hypothetical protein
MEVSWGSKESRRQVCRLANRFPRARVLDVVVLVVAIVAFALAVVFIALLVDPGRG